MSAKSRRSTDCRQVQIKSDYPGSNSFKRIWRPLGQPISSPRKFGPVPAWSPITLCSSSNHDTPFHAPAAKVLLTLVPSGPNVRSSAQFALKPNTLLPDAEHSEFGFPDPIEFSHSMNLKILHFISKNLRNGEVHGTGAHPIWGFVATHNGTTGSPERL
jgi:hypothetical protein